MQVGDSEVSRAREPPALVVQQPQMAARAELCQPRVAPVALAHHKHHEHGQLNLDPQRIQGGAEMIRAIARADHGGERASLLRSRPDPLLRANSRR